MKKYSNVPLKERKRNADRCYRHEVRLEEINEKREMKRYIEEKEKQCDYENKTDKDREFDNVDNEVYKRLKAIEKRVL